MYWFASSSVSTIASLRSFGWGLELFAGLGCMGLGFLKALKWALIFSRPFAGSISPTTITASRLGGTRFYKIA